MIEKDKKTLQGNNSDQSAALSLREAAALLGIKEKCVYPLIYRGVLRKGKIGVKTGVTRESVEAEVLKRKLRSENYTIADAARELSISYTTVKNDGDLGRFIFKDGYITKDSYEKYIAWRKSLPSNGRMIATKKPAQSLLRLNTLASAMVWSNTRCGKVLSFGMLTAT